jgi:hypothetical protein
MAAGSSLGGIVFPIMMERLILSVGFGWAMRSAAFLILALLIVSILTIRSRSPPTPHPLTRSILLQPFREVEMMLVVIGFMLVTFGVFVPVNYLVVDAIASGMSVDLSRYLVAILNAGRYVPTKCRFAFSTKRRA